MSWETRVQDTIVLLSPSKIPVPAYWIPPDEVSFSRHVAVHDVPNRAGSYVQDLGAGARRYPITLAFEGENADLLAKTAEDLFFAEQGAWTVIHPTDLFLRLNLVSCARTNDPVSSGGFVMLKTEWVEVGLVSAGLGGILESANTIARSCLTLAALSVSTVTTAVNIVQRGLLNQYVYGCLEKLAILIGGWTLTGDTLNMYANLKNEAQHIDALNSEVFNTLLLNTCVTALSDKTNINAILAAKNIKDTAENVCANIEQGTKRYNNLGGNFAIKMVNEAYFVEIFLTAFLAAFAQIVIKNKIRNRDECVLLISIFNSIYNKVIQTAAIYEQKSMTLQLTQQYAAFSNSLGEIEKLRSLVIRYLLQELYDLKAIRRITLEKPTTILQICFQYMGADASTIDDKIDEFIESNDINGKEILLLPAGKEVVIYT